MIGLPLSRMQASTTPNQPEVVGRPLGAAPLLFIAGGIVSAVFSAVFIGSGGAWSQNTPNVATPNSPANVTGVIASDNSVTWYVNPTNGNDRTGDGSPNKPLATLTYALRVAQARGGGTIQLGAGTYDLNSGEQFPLIVGTRTIVRGNEATKGQEIQIVGGGEYNPSSFSSNNLTLLVPKGATGVEIRGVTVINPSPRGYGLWVDGASPAILSSTFTGNQIAGMILMGDSMAILANNIFLRNGNAGLIVDGTAKPTIRSNVFQQTGFGLDVRQAAQPQVNENLFYSNQDGIIIQANARPMLRGNLIENNQRNGIILNASAGLDFGDVNDSAGNVLRNNGELDIVNASRLPVVSNGNQFNPRRSRGQVRFLDKSNLVAVAPNKSNTANPSNGLSTSLSVQPLSFNPSATNGTAQNQTNNTPAKPENRNISFPSVIDQQTLNNANTAFGRNGQTNSQLLNLTNNYPSSRNNGFSNSNNFSDGLTVLNPNPLGNPLIVQVNTGGSSGSNGMGVVALSSPNITPDLQPVVTRPPAGQPVNQPIVTAPPVYVTNNRSNPSFTAPKYRVIVRDSRPNTISLVKRLIPNAFASQLNGQMVIQVGAYADRRVADAQVQRLAKEGLVAQVQNIR
jgi:parallel beta-helix repeat protein